MNNLFPLLSNENILINPIMVNVFSNVTLKQIACTCMLSCFKWVNIMQIVA